MGCCEHERASGPASGAVRKTAQRRQLQEAVERMRAAFTVGDLVESFDASARRPSRATAYRAVRAMCASGVLERIGDRDGHALYAHCAGADTHHHHLMCTACGAVAETVCPLGPDADDAARRAGFVLTGHDVVLYGLCGRCADGARG